MTGNLKTAFDGILAEDNLKANTLSYLQNEIQKRSKARDRGLVMRFAVAFTSAAAILLSVMLTYNLYFTPGAYVDVDVNPSIELTLNRFDRVIDAQAYNEAGDDMLSGLSLTHKNCGDALIILIDAIDQNGYIKNDGLVSVTLQTDNENKETELLAAVQTDVEGYMNKHHHTAQIDVFSVSRDTRSHAHELNISPAKYLAIQELIEVDPTVTMESCRDHSVSEIRELTREHKGSHHSDGNAGDSEEPIDDENCGVYNNEAPDFGQNDSHHGGSGGNGHHGGVDE